MVAETARKLSTAGGANERLYRPILYPVRTRRWEGTVGLTDEVWLQWGEFADGLAATGQR